VDVPPSVIEACKRGDPRAFEELVRLTHRQVYSVAFRLLGNPDDAADVSQETYLKLLRAIRTFRGEAKFSTWLYRVTSSVAISALRKRARRLGELSLEAEAAEELPSLIDPGREVERKELGNQIEIALRALPTGYRTVVVMKDIYGFSLEEIGKHLGITEGAAKVRLFRARQRLKDMLHEERPVRVGNPRRPRSRGTS
jgi:RNA polymerase sigma-70 factor (ECF subfamily)